MPRVSMNSITCAKPVCVFKLVMTKGLSPLAVVRMRTLAKQFQFEAMGRQLDTPAGAAE